MFDVFGKKKLSDQEDFDEAAINERRARAEKDEAIIYISDSLKKYTDDLKGQQKSVNEALKNLEGALLAGPAKEKIVESVDVGDAESLLEKFDVEPFKLSKVKEELTEGVKKAAESLETVDTSIPAAPEKPSLSDIKAELENIRKTQNSIMEEVLSLKNIASRGDVLALTATIESSKIGDAAIPIAYVAGDLRGIVSDIRAVCDKVCELSEGTKAIDERIDKLIDDKAVEINDKAQNFSKEVEAKLGEIDAAVKTSRDKVDSLAGAGAVLDDVSQSIRDKARKNSENVDAKLKGLGEVFVNMEKADEDFQELQDKMKTAISNVSTDESIYEKIGDLLEQIRPIVQED